jgi:hypothetical protein
MGYPVTTVYKDEGGKLTKISNLQKFNQIYPIFKQKCLKFANFSPKISCFERFQIKNKHNLKFLTFFENLTSASGEGEHRGPRTGITDKNRSVTVFCGYWFRFFIGFATHRSWFRSVIFLSVSQIFIY